MEYLGHAQISTTMDIYGRVLDETRTAAASKIDELLSHDEGEEDEKEVGK
jgi:integrase